MMAEGKKEYREGKSPGTKKLLINGSLWDPRFYPAYTPHDMLDMGVFGGTYLNSVRDSLPSRWFNGGKILPKGSKPDVSMNFFKVSSGMSLSDWEKRGWIMSDKLGWFQWYCNYFLGRRIGEDEIQINRWRQFCARHSAQVHKNPWQPRLRQKQGLLHWSYDWRDKIHECQDKNLAYIISSTE